MKVLFLTPYPTGQAASQRFRFEQYFHLLKERGIECEVSGFLDEGTWKLIYEKGFLMVKFWGMIKGLLRRIGNLIGISNYDMVFVHREALPIGPPIIEWMVTRVFRKKLVFDFDDAIWVPNYSESNKFFSFLKRYSDVSRVCKWSHKVSCGNQYLCNYARQYNANVIYNPTTIDTDDYHNREKDYTNIGEKKFVIGWTGSHSTIRYLFEIVPVLKELERDHDFDFHVISDQDPHLDLKSFKFVKWNRKTEIDDLIKFDIGLMPLTNDTWANGKCGFKALQYMALGIPAVVSPMSENSQMVEDMTDGLICNTLEDWKKKLEMVLNDKLILQRLSRHTREKIVKSYSVNSNKDNFLSLFEL